jgi:hypothetical protein
MKFFPLTIYLLLFLASNLSFKFSRQTQKKLVGISHYGHFRLFAALKLEISNKRKNCKL